MKDCYKILGIDKGSTDDEIKMAYKKLAMKYHPDRNPNDIESEEKFKEIKMAYETLMNKNDLNNLKSDFFSNNNNLNNFMNNDESLNDVFKVIFQKEFKEFNKNVVSSVDIDLEQSFYGCILNVNIPYKINCKFCSGKGSKSGTTLKVCDKCDGTGLHLIIQGLFTFKQKCIKCEGKGLSSDNTCIKCEGNGHLNKELNCSLNIPKKLNSNILKLNIINSDYDKKIFPDKNLHISIKIKPHPIFNKKGIDLYCKYVINFMKSLLGGMIRVYSLYGYLTHRIRKGTQPGDMYKIKNRGFNNDSKVGDFYVEIFIEIPLFLNFYQKFLIKKLKISILENKSVFPLSNKMKNLIYFFYKNIFNND